MSAPVNFHSLHDLQALAKVFATVAPACDYWSLRLVAEHWDRLEVRQGVMEPAALGHSLGAMVTVVTRAGLGYAATNDLSRAGLRAAGRQARDWALAHDQHGLFDAALLPRATLQATYDAPVEEPWGEVPLSDKLALLQQANAALAISPRILDCSAWLGWNSVDQLLVSSAGAQIAHHLEFLHSGLLAVANAGDQTQRRLGGGADWPQQGGLERLAALGFVEAAPQVAEEALALLEAPECPTETLDLVLMPSQMMLQIHESIGHPLELDRILGDERNYAGTSFVTPAMFGQYRYGSELLNVTFDPGVPGELASVVADDDGTLAERVHLIRNGVLERPLGGALSQARAGLPGTANARASGWDRPPIDRMGNLNLEPGSATLAELIGGVERGVLMETNRSWSIDDSRNKFQFGCELGRLIIDGELGELVRNPGYLGCSAEFWRSLDGVGAADTVEVRGLCNCGKGEPNQSLYVGHASPPCRFRQVDVFGGGA
ncbi:TldD/PmbA family protein [Rhabdochromatium marinum]|uniref:TldD/PmbA family protein n=1 Tax=Rhabdochromatium marinum TaxID=48729 RepID=UPI0019057670|nr:TldD/PmbA family protein [Rhabdochromatium marinum]MBK1648377.1 peptidase C69 [Rhabdochromatium marinum]